MCLDLTLIRIAALLTHTNAYPLHIYNNNIYLRRFKYIYKYIDIYIYVYANYKPIQMVAWEFQVAEWVSILQDFQTGVGVVKKIIICTVI